MRALVVIVGAVLAAAGTRAEDVSGAPVEVAAEAEATSITIGTPFAYTVVVSTAEGVETVVTQPTERIGEFEIVDFGLDPAREEDGRVVVRRSYALVGWTPGDHVIRSPAVRVRGDGEELREVPAIETPVTVESVLATEESPTDIRDIRAPLPIPVDWRPYALLAAGVVALVGLGVLLYRLLNRPRRAASVPPPRPAHEVAAAALVRLARRRLLEAGEFKEYYSELTAIVRTYLEQRFALRAPEMTTEEFLTTSARDGRLTPAHRRLLGEFLSESDLVKFARHRPTREDGERAHAAARRFVDETASTTASEEHRAAG